MTDLVDVHDKVEMVPPGGEDPVRIDVELEPVIFHLWRLGFTTLLSCQDLGESIAGGGTTTRPEHRERGRVQWEGYAWLKLPVDEAMRFLSFAVELPGFESVHEGGLPRGWEALTWLLPGRTASYGNVYIPRTRLRDLGQALSTQAGG